MVPEVGELDATYPSLKTAIKDQMTPYYHAADVYRQEHPEIIQILFDLNRDQMIRCRDLERMGREVADKYGKEGGSILEAYQSCHLEYLSEEWALIKKVQETYGIANPEEIIRLDEMKPLDRAKEIYATDLHRLFSEVDTCCLRLVPTNHFPRLVFQMEDLEVLDLTGSKIKRIPKDMRKLRGLKILNLGRNELTDLPDSMGKLGRLERLDLSGNRLKKLPSSIRELRKLQRLDVSKNVLRRLPETSGWKAIMQIDASGNRLTTIPRDLVVRGSAHPWLSEVRCGKIAYVSKKCVPQDTPLDLTVDDIRFRFWRRSFGWREWFAERPETFKTREQRLFVEELFEVMDEGGYVTRKLAYLGKKLGPTLTKALRAYGAPLFENMQIEKPDHLLDCLIDVFDTEPMRGNPLSDPPAEEKVKKGSGSRCVIQ